MEDICYANQMIDICIICIVLITDLIRQRIVKNFRSLKRNVTAYIMLLARSDSSCSIRLMMSNNDILEDRRFLLQ